MANVARDGGETMGFTNKDDGPTRVTCLVGADATELVEERESLPRRRGVR
jgi:hypothetical protein